ncbi:hypothetical protein DPMN_061579 [Dreissena polymorpha]|uniref:Uncharacterized protein n=1 Tax=Dreissena polymorpha TaxID=45954 RepID=A0A9D4HHA7_DREPO|nr:hypothetical protein DPMN_061579 [Dreissena polymorpha]
MASYVSHVGVVAYTLFYSVHIHVTYGLPRRIYPCSTQSATLGTHTFKYHDSNSEYAHVHIHYHGSNSEYTHVHIHVTYGLPRRIYPCSTQSATLGTHTFKYHGSNSEYAHVHIHVTYGLPRRIYPCSTQSATLGTHTFKYHDSNSEYAHVHIHLSTMTPICATLATHTFKYHDSNSEYAHVLDSVPC